MKPDISILRVSVATMDRVHFRHPWDGTPMLALERQAAVSQEGKVVVKCQPFGGGVHILDQAPLEELLGTIQFDSEQSRTEADLRLLMPSSRWETLKEFCLHHLADDMDRYLESTPHRELSEEFAEAVQVELAQDQYMAKRAGFVLENHPAQTQNVNSPGVPTVRIYLIFNVELVDPPLVHQVIQASDRYTDQDLKALVLEDHGRKGTGRINSVLTLPLNIILQRYLQLSREDRFQMVNIDDHWLDSSTLSILPEVEIEQYQRII